MRKKAADTDAEAAEEEKKAKWKETFNLYDKDGDGTVSTTELGDHTPISFFSKICTDYPPFLHTPAHARFYSVPSLIEYLIRQVRSSTLLVSRPRKPT